MIKRLFITNEVNQGKGLSESHELSLAAALFLLSSRFFQLKPVYLHERVFLNLSTVYCCFQPQTIRLSSVKSWQVKVLLRGKHCPLCRHTNKGGADVMSGGDEDGPELCSPSPPP